MTQNIQEHDANYSALNPALSKPETILKFTGLLCVCTAMGAQAPLGAILLDQNVFKKLTYSCSRFSFSQLLCRFVLK